MTLPEPHIDHWEGFAMRKQGSTFSVKDFYGYETRNESLHKLLICAATRHGVGDFDWVLVWTGDVSPLVDRALVDFGGVTYPCFAFSTQTGNFSSTIPDFVFDHWRQTGLMDYEETRLRLQFPDLAMARTDCLGWRGALTHPTRSKLIELDDKANFDCELVEWNRNDPDRLTAANFLSFEQQVAKWRYLIDLQGMGYSGRLKLLLSSPRVVFVQERRHEEFFFPLLKPWGHYVPVKEDLSDLERNLNHLKANPRLEADILEQARAFSQRYLTRDHALLTIAERLKAQTTRI